MVVDVCREVASKIFWIIVAGFDFGRCASSRVVTQHGSLIHVTVDVADRKKNSENLLQKFPHRDTRLWAHR